MSSLQHPEQIQIETINGICSARCTMCTILSWKREPHIMPMEMYEEILQKCKTIQGQKYLTLHGLGEPLLDQFLPERVRMAKDMDYKGIGFASNCTHLSEEMAALLLEAGLHTIICSIDGIHKETHENIRIGTNFDSIVENVLRFVQMRNAGKYATRVLVRFIRQESNFTEWEAYKQLWDSRLDASKGDGVLRFDAHNWGESKKICRVKKELSTENVQCADLLNRLFIRSNGDVALCCADDNGYFELGNVLRQDPLEIYNTGHFARFRTAMQEGKLLDLHPCSECSIVQVRETRILAEESV